MPAVQRPVSDEPRRVRRDWKTEAILRLARDSEAAAIEADALREAPDPPCPARHGGA
jgi:hypothetical protein